MTKKENSKGKNYLKNYVVLIILFVVCFGFTLYLCRWYEVYNEYKKEIPVIRGTLSEIVYEDLDHYVLDNSNVIIYICTSNDEVCRSFEKGLKKFVSKDELNEDIIYLNLTGIDQDRFVNEFNSKYTYKSKLSTNYPAFVVFRNGYVESILQGNDKKSLTISNVRNFLELNEYDEE